MNNLFVTDECNKRRYEILQEDRQHFYQSLLTNKFYVIGYSVGDPIESQCRNFVTLKAKLIQQLMSPFHRVNVNSFPLKSTKIAWR